MASDASELTGLHFVRTDRGPLKSRWQVYAWRGGPRIMTADQILKPQLTQAALVALGAAHEQKIETPEDTFAGLVAAYLASPEYRDRADSSKRDYKRYCESAVAALGTAKLKLFADPRFRGDVIAWRDKWSHAPRAAHYAMQVLSRVCSWGLERGFLTVNPAESIASSYSTDRSDIIWTDEEIEAVAAEMAPHVARAFKLAAWTGLPRGDLVALLWSDVGDLYISRKRNKTGVDTVIPLFDETRALLKQFPKTAVTVVTTERGKPFAPRGFAMAVERARKAAGVAEGKTLHDVRGTFATRLMDAGFEDSEVDEVLGWETGKSTRIRRRYISRRNVVISAINRMRERSAKK